MPVLKYNSNYSLLPALPPGIGYLLSPVLEINKFEVIFIWFYNIPIKLIISQIIKNLVAIYYGVKKLERFFEATNKKVLKRTIGQPKVPKIFGDFVFINNTPYSFILYCSNKNSSAFLTNEQFYNCSRVSIKVIILGLYKRLCFNSE